MKKEKPRVTVRLDEFGNFAPVTAYDAEQLAQAPRSQMYDLVPISDRSPQHHKLYWSILGSVCAATGKWPTSEHLHRELKMACGFYQTIISEFGGIYYLPDSIAMNKMDQREFNQFFELAMSKLAEAIGYDPITGEGE